MSENVQTATSVTDCNVRGVWLEEAMLSQFYLYFESTFTGCDVLRNPLPMVETA